MSRAIVSSYPVHRSSTQSVRFLSEWGIFSACPLFLRASNSARKYSQSSDVNGNCYRWRSFVPLKRRLANDSLNGSIPPSLPSFSNLREFSTWHSQAAVMDVCVLLVTGVIVTEGFIQLAWAMVGSNWDTSESPLLNLPGLSRCVATMSMKSTPHYIFGAYLLRNVFEGAGWGFFRFNSPDMENFDHGSSLGLHC